MALCILIIALYGHSNYADYSAVNVNNPRPGNHMAASGTPRDATFSWTLFLDFIFLLSSYRCQSLEHCYN